MYLSERELAKLGCTAEDIARKVAASILDADDGRGSIELQTHQTRESTLDKVTNIYDRISESNEVRNLLADFDLEEPVMDWLRDHLDDVGIDAVDDLSSNDQDFLVVFKAGANECLAEVLTALRDAEYDAGDAAANNDHVELLDARGLFDDYDIDSIKDAADYSFREGLAYWTTYWTPASGSVDTAAAAKCGLVAFEFEEDEYLALGGCGMDLSPRLDAYQALTRDSLPPDSRFFNDRSYFEHVVGDDVAAEVDSRTRLNPPLLVVTVPWPPVE